MSTHFSFQYSDDMMRRICGELLRRYPGGTFEIGLVNDTRIEKTRYTVRADELLPALAGLCGHLPEIIVKMNFDHPYGLIGRMWCHCTDENRARCANPTCPKSNGSNGSNGHDNRPKINILLTALDQRPILIGHLKPPCPVQHPQMGTGI